MSCMKLNYKKFHHAESDFGSFSFNLSRRRFCRFIFLAFSRRYFSIRNLQKQSIYTIFYLAVLYKKFFEKCRVLNASHLTWGSTNDGVKNFLRLYLLFKCHGIAYSLNRYLEVRNDRITDLHKNYEQILTHLKSDSFKVQLMFALLQTNPSTSLGEWMFQQYIRSGYFLLGDVYR